MRNAQPQRSPPCPATAAVPQDPVNPHHAVQPRCATMLRQSAPTPAMPVAQQHPQGPCLTSDTSQIQSSTQPARRAQRSVGAHTTLPQRPMAEYTAQQELPSPKPHKPASEQGAWKKPKQMPTPSSHHEYSPLSGHAGPDKGPPADIPSQRQGKQCQPLPTMFSGEGGTAAQLQACRCCHPGSCSYLRATSQAFVTQHKGMSWADFSQPASPKLKTPLVSHNSDAHSEPQIKSTLPHVHTRRHTHSQAAFISY
jgi:hypothetical protein